MTPCTLETSVVDWILEHPETMGLLEDLGIDCSCAGKSLDYACHQRGLDPAEVLARLHRLLRSSHQPGATGSDATPQDGSPL